MKNGKILDPIEFSIVTMEGRIIWLRWQSSKVELNNKMFIQVIIQDITEKKESEQNLLESEEYYRFITEIANDLIRVLNERFETEFVNELVNINILGYPKTELLGKPAIFLNHPEDYTSIRHFLRKVFKSGEGTHKSRIRHKNGHWIWFEIKVKIFKNKK